MHKLTFIAIVGLTASAVCMGAAAAIGGRNFGEGLEGFSWFDGKPHCETVAGATANSRDLDWDGRDHVGLAVLGQASYSPGTGEKVHVTGDPQILAHLRVHDGDIELDCRGWHSRTRDLAITLPGRQFRKFEIAGGGRMVLDRLDQASAKIEIAGAGSVKANGKIDDLKMEIAGSGDADFDSLVAHHAKVEIGGSGTVKAKGNVDELGIEIAGSGRADFGQVTSRNAKVEIAGNGNVDIAPSDEAKIEIGGSGDVYLHSNPKTLDTDIGGSGRIHRVPPAG